MALLSAAALSSANAARPLWLRFAYRVGKDAAIKGALAYGVTLKALLFFVIEPGNVVMFWAYTLLYGVAFGAAPTLLRSMMADLTDVDELATGKKRAGLFFALLTTTNKLGSALAVGVVLTLVEKHLSRQILEHIGEVGEFDAKPGTGIAVVIDVEDAVGVMHQAEELTEIVEENL